MKILDCTLRDGGYYNNWDFNRELVESYCSLMENSPIDYVEVGYRSVPLNGYFGKYFYCPDFILEELKKLLPSKKLVLMINEKDVLPENIEKLLKSCVDVITMVRIAINPSEIQRGIILAKKIKMLGFEIAFNIMYMSNWKSSTSFLNKLSDLNDLVDYIYMVDSHGGVFNDDVAELAKLLKTRTNIKLGFHGHNNMEMALSNSITALNNGCEIVDMTVSGMGRGAGNLKTELFLTYMNSRGVFDINYNILTKTVSMFENLRLKYNWGTSLPYMFSGAFSIPQKEVMEWLGMNRYPLPMILSLLNQKVHIGENNLDLPIFNPFFTSERVFILGGGESLKEVLGALITYLGSNNDVVLIHTGLKYINNFKNVTNKQFLALASFSWDDNTEIADIFNSETKRIIYPPVTSASNISNPDKIPNFSSRLDSIKFTNASIDSPLAIATQAALDLGVKELFLLGFDGYDSVVNKQQMILMKENQLIFNDLLLLLDLKITFLTPTKYVNINQSSIYSML